MSPRLFGLVLALSAEAAVTTCRSPGEADRSTPASAEPTATVELPAADTSSLTPREHREWSTYVSELLAPCPDQPVSVAQCVREARPCKPCAPAASFLVRQVQKGFPRSKVEAAYRIRFAPDKVRSIDLSGSPSKGPDSAPVTIVEWADFECPFCGAASPILDQKVEAFPGKVRLVFKNYPLSSHPHAETAARAAVAAKRQGRFWEMHRALFDAQETGLEKSRILKLARSLGLDVQKFQADLESEAVADDVARDRRAADALELSGTPLIYVNGRHFDLDYFGISEDLDDWIALEIELKTGAKVKPLALEPPPSASAIASAGSAPPPPASGAKVTPDRKPSPAPPAPSGR